jgi:endonuclease-3 related protein
VIEFEPVFDALLAAYGPQHWWPADDAFEIMVGAILVQRTAWRNAEVALGQLRLRELLAPESLAAAEVEVVRECIRSAGFFQSKAARLIGLAEFVQRSGGVASLTDSTTSELRELLLLQKGIGPETADAILLYAFHRPAVVIDEYLRRFAQRWTASPVRIPDGTLRQWVAATIRDVIRLNEMHALVIRHGRESCGKIPRCGQCELKTRCRTGKAVLDA